MLYRFRPSPAMVVASLALVTALSSGAYAAFSLPKNSVGSKQLKKHAVTPSKVAPKTVALFKGQKGDKGDRGQPGPRGAQGPGATSFTTSVANDDIQRTVATVNGIDVNATCSVGGSQQILTLSTTGNTNTLQASGTRNAPDPAPVHADADSSSSGGPAATVEYDVIARNTASGQSFSRFDVHISGGSPCPVWGMITPSTFTPSG